MNTIPLYFLAIAFFLTGGTTGLALGVAVLLAAVTIDHDTPRT